MMAFGATPLSTTALGDNQFPVSAVAVPDEASGNLTALEGGPESTDSNNNKTAPASVYIKDGNDVTLGISTDANTVNSVMGRLTKIRDLLSATLTVAVSGNVTEANSAAIKADLDAINVAIGTISDVAWSGSGNGSEIAILKKIVADLASTLTVSGSISISNLPATQPVSGTVAVSNFPATQPVSGTFFQTTQPVSAASLPLPTGAAQEAGNLASVASNTSNVATVAGATADAAVTGDNSGTLSAKLRGLAKIFTDIWDSVNHRIKVDGSGVTQPVSGTFWQTTQPVSGTVTANQGGTWNVAPQAGTSGGAIPSHTITASGTNATSLKSSAGQVYNLQISNGAASACYFRFYNLAGAPTVGTSAIAKTIQVPANGTVIIAWTAGLVFTTGIAWAVTGAIGDADTTSVSTNVSVDIDYK